MKTLVAGVVLSFLLTALPIGASAQIVDPDAPSGNEILEQASDTNKNNFSLIPDCLRKASEVRTADGGCITYTITFYTNLLLYLVGIGAFAYMLYGAFLYATAFGDENKVGRAKKTITYAIIGVILAGSALLIVQLIRSILQA
jgi:hypothetical protein